MPLPNRVDPFGNLFADPARGTFMGNRGGRIHDAGRRLSQRRWASRQWICCVLAFNNRHRAVWSEGYTELFFLDEPTAFAAGHRPCFECRHADAAAFAQAFGKEADVAGRHMAGQRMRADAMDRILHGERLEGRRKRLHRLAIEALPDGAAITLDSYTVLMLKAGRLLRWSPSGYADAGPRPRGITVDTLTPPAIVQVLANGYRPVWHVSADEICTL
ncbi:MAG TPA: hypothetical protein VNQ56_11730 [Pseudolabrys sp.]|nr:hypothetical protein [Pseudolabrys sp.]